MIDRSHGKIVFECDACPEVFESGTNDFSEAWEMAKADGWRAHKFGNIYEHSCAKCKVSA